jgi:hypothetical protein
MSNRGEVTIGFTLDAFSLIFILQQSGHRTDLLFLQSECFFGSTGVLNLEFYHLNNGSSPLLVIFQRGLVLFAWTCL